MHIRRADGTIQYAPGDSPEEKRAKAQTISELQDCTVVVKLTAIDAGTATLRVWIGTADGLPARELLYSPVRMAEGERVTVTGLKWLSQARLVGWDANGAPVT